MMQVPNLPNYMTVPQQPNYNAVKIDVHNPMVNVPATQGQVQECGCNPKYEAPTMPFYTYPQAPYQAFYMPPQITTPENKCPGVQPAQQPAQPAPQVQVQEIPVKPQVVPPAPMVTEAPKAEEKKDVEEKPANEIKESATEEKPVEVAAPEEIKPQVDINEFIAKLTNPDFEIQAAAMNEIANMISKEPEKAQDLLQPQIVKALEGIMNADTTGLAGRTPEQTAIDQKVANNEQLTDQEKEIYAQLSPKDQAERNKSFAIFTAALMQKLYGEEYTKLNNATVPLTELPGAVAIVEQLKNNPNARVRTSAIEALSFIQNPNYKKDLTTIFTIAQNDQDTSVQEAAKAALEELNKLPDAPAETAQAA